MKILYSYRPKIIAPIMVMIAFFMVTSCDDIFGPDSSSALAETKWHLEAFEDASPPEDQKYRLTFVSESRFGGRSDCNEIGGSYEAFTNGSLRFGDIISTYMQCIDGSKYLEFQRWLQTTNAFEIEGDRLTLSTRKGDLIFERTAKQNQ